MDANSKQPKETQVRKLESFVRKLGDEEIKMFLVVLDSIMKQVPAPKDARKSYLSEVEKRLRNNGVDFLSKSRVFPTFGLKLLGSDRNGFPIPGFKQQKGKIYPSLFAWYWSELERLSFVSKPNKDDVLRAQRVLCVLSFAKMIKCSSVNQIRKSLMDFEKRVEPPIPRSKDELNEMLSRCASIVETTLQQAEPIVEPCDSPTKSFFETGPSLMETLGIEVDLETLPYVDLGSLSNKPSALKDKPEFPYWFMPQFLQFLNRFIAGGELPLFGFKPPPYGKIHVLTESAGKLRIICPYNTPFAHSTGLYARCRHFLRRLRADYSENQADGHRFVQKMNAKGDKLCVSADLSNFTDDISPEAISFGFRSLGLSAMRNYFFRLPVTLPNGKVIVPDKLLMGLKGCFEFSTLLHHYCVRRAGIGRNAYAMCGDDLFFRGDIDAYLDVLNNFGWSLNRSKTVISKTAAVFCGEMYWFGHRVSPRVPKVSACFRNGKPASTTILFSTTRSNILLLNKIYSRRNVLTVMSSHIQLLRSRWKGLIFYELPQKLRGLGLRTSRPGKGLITLLESRPVLYTAKMSIGIKKERMAQHRFFGLPIELAPSDIQREYPDFPALLAKGAVTLEILQGRPAPSKKVSALDDLSVYEWYYENVRLEPHQLGIYN